MLLWSDIYCCLIWNFRTCNLATQKSPLSQQNGKCRVSAEKGITSLSHCHRPGAQAQPQARGTDCSRQTSIRGRNRRKHRKRMLKRTLICLLTVWGGHKNLIHSGKFFWEQNRDVCGTNMELIEKVTDSCGVNSAWKNRIFSKNT